MLDQSYISALAALASSAIGGLTTLGAAWVTQKPSRERAADCTGKENFIDDASKFYADALAHDQAKLSALVSMYASVSKMRVISNPTVVKKAEAVVRAIVDTYFAPNKTFPELRQMIDNHAIDPLRDFSEACRNELEALTRRGCFFQMVGASSRFARVCTT